MTTEIITSELADEMRYAQAVAVAPERGAAQSLLPAAYRGNPANVLIAVGLGKAIGIAPAQALYDIYVVNGRPSPSANLMAALVRRAGHKIRISGDATSCTATLIRKDDPDEPFAATWTLEQARAAGLAGKDTWKAYPAAMLRSRAIAEVVRMGASECVLGMDYSAEEMRDVEKPAAAATPAFIPASAPAPDSTEDETVEATLEPDETGEAITDRTRKAMFALFNEVGEKDPQGQRDGIARVIGRTVESRSDLTEVEGQAVVDSLRAFQRQQATAAEMAPEGA